MIVYIMAPLPSFPFYIAFWISLFAIQVQLDSKGNVSFDEVEHIIITTMKKLAVEKVHQCAANPPVCVLEYFQVF